MLCVPFWWRWGSDVPPCLIPDWTVIYQGFQLQEGSQTSRFSAHYRMDAGSGSQSTGYTPLHSVSCAVCDRLSLAHKHTKCGEWRSAEALPRIRMVAVVVSESSPKGHFRFVGA